MYDPDKFNDSRPNCGVTVIPVIYNEGKMKVLTYVRPDDAEEFPSCLAFPNGFVDRKLHKNVEEAAIFALDEKTQAQIGHFEQLQTFSGIYIDPNRIMTVNVAFFALLKPSEYILDEDSNGKWLSIESLLELPEDEFSFNHKEVLNCAYERIKSKADYSPVALSLLDDEFTIPEFQLLTEKLMGQSINEKTFRTKIKKADLLVDTGKKSSPSKKQRPSMLYKLNPDFNGYFYPRAMFS